MPKNVVIIQETLSFPMDIKHVFFTDDGEMCMEMLYATGLYNVHDPFIVLMMGVTFSIRDIITSIIFHVLACKINWG